MPTTPAAHQLPELGWRITLVSDAEEATAAATAALKAAEEAADLRKWKAVEAEPEFLPELPADVWQHIVSYFRLAYHIGRAAPTSRALSVAAKLAIKVRQFSSEVVTLTGHTELVRCVAAVPDGRVITGSYDSTVMVWRDGACERAIHAHTGYVNAVAALPGGARFVSVSDDGTAKLWSLDGAQDERTPRGGQQYVDCVAALPDGVRFVLGLSNSEVRLYRVDGTLVHTFEGHAGSVTGVAVTPDGQHIISGSDDKLVKVWSVASKSLFIGLVSTCVGHTEPVRAVASMPDGQRILSGGGQDRPRVAPQRHPQEEIPVHTKHA